MSIEQTAAKPANLLVATDLSARSDRAVERALLLARQMRASLTILHVVEADRPGAISDRRRDEARSHIADLLGALTAADLPVAVEIALGEASGEILEAADRLGAAVILLGVHRNEGLEPFRATTAAQVIRKGTRPVLLVKTRPQVPYRRVLIGVDFSDCSRCAVEFAVRLLPDGEFHLVHAFDVPFKGFLTGDETRREVSKSHQEQMDRFLEACCAALRAEQPRLVPAMRQGMARQVLDEQVAKTRPDLLVLGTHGRRGLGRALLGSVAEDFLSRPPCDVLAVRQ